MPEQKTRQSLPEAGGRSLRLRLLFWIILWLIPVGIVSSYQGYSRVQDDVEEVRERLIRIARTSAADVEGVLIGGAQVLRALSNQPEVQAGGPGCNRALANAMRGLSFYTEIARINDRGEVICAAAGPGPELRNVADQPWWSEARSQTEFFVTPQIYSTVARSNVLGGVLPLRDQADGFNGALEFALDVFWLDVLLRAKPIPEGAVIALFDQASTIVASNDPDLAVQIFAERPHAPRGDELFSARADRDTWSFALVPLLDNAVSVGFAMRNRTLFASTYFHVATDLLIPVLVLGLSSLAIWFAADRLITRWIVYLRRIAMAYARGHYAVRPVLLDEAPSEFRTLGETLSTMAAAVQDRDRKLRDALAQKSLLIKETHHRVKNNLQIVMSLLSLQAARVRDPVAQMALRQAQMRVNALALVHRILHEIEDLGAVDLKRLIHDLGRQIQEGFGGERRDVQLEVNVGTRLVPSELAVPLTLFTVEALTNAFKHAFPVGSRGGVIRVRLTPIEGGKLRLAIEDDGTGLEQRPPGGGIGSRLIQALADQVGGTATVASRDHRGTVVELIFPDPFQERQKKHESVAA